MKLEVNIEKFNLSSFLDESEKKGEGIMNPTVQVIENLEDCWEDEIEVYPSDYLIDKLVNDDKYLYVNFSEPGLNREINCIDGGTYYLINEEDYEIEMEEEDGSLPEDVAPVKNLYISESESIGYLLKYEDYKLTIQSAIYYLHGKQFVGPCGMGSTTEIEIEDDVEIFEQPMLEYITQYVIK